MRMGEGILSRTVWVSLALEGSSAVLWAFCLSQSVEGECRGWTKSANPCRRPGSLELLLLPHAGAGPKGPAEA